MVGIPVTAEYIKNGFSPGAVGIVGELKDQPRVLATAPRGRSIQIARAVEDHAARGLRAVNFTIKRVERCLLPLRPANILQLEHASKTVSSTLKSRAVNGVIRAHGKPDRRT